MKRSKMHLVKSGNNVRASFSERKEVTPMPNLIEVQLDSYIWFLQEGLKEVFNDVFPIQDQTGNLKLSVDSFRVEAIPSDEKNERIADCKEKDTTYAAPLKVTFMLEKKEKGTVEKHEVYLGDLPIMTETGSFIVNGTERVVVSQMVRSPSIYFDMTRDKIGKKLYNATMIPNRGAWIELESDSNDVLWVRVDRTRKVPVTVFVRALLGKNEDDPTGTNSALDSDIYNLFGEEEKIKNSIAREVDTDKNYAGGIIELYKKIRPGEQLSVQSAQGLLSSSLFDPKRYDLGRAGRYKYNKKLNFRYRVRNLTLAESVISEDGELLYKKGTLLTEEIALDIQNRGIAYIVVYVPDTEGETEKILSSKMVDINYYIKGVKEEEWNEIGITENVYYPVLMELMDYNNKENHGKKETLLQLIKENSFRLIPKHLTKEDVFATINYCCHINKGIGNVDDIDHLGNRRIRAVGELLQNQYRIGLSRLDRVVRDRFRSFDIDEMTPQSLINIKPVTAAIKEFFGSSQLSQFMDQNNPLSEITHKRRLSALGPGGINRERAGFEVRDVHYTHYGRVCPIETPEGPNIGLINSLATYARVNKYGFIESPYRKVDKSNPRNPVVTDEVVYMTADIEDNYRIAQASEPLDEEGHFINDNVSGRFADEILSFRKTDADYMDISPRMVFSVATSMIPFVQNDDANRALMGSNMQRQAVPLMITETSAVGTGMENKAAVDSGVCVTAKEKGTVTYVDANKIIVKDINGLIDEYKLQKFKRSNQSNSYNQKPTVDIGDVVEKGQVIADGTSTSKGELSLGRNPLIGFMTWEGYNYEDAVLISERLVKDDVYTSIHIEEYEVEARETKLGKEEITNDIPGVGDESLKDLDENGIIRVGAEVKATDILVGKLTPKGEQDITSEERLVRAIFKEKSKEVRDTSLRLPHGAYGTVIAVNVFTKKDGILSAGVNEKVRVYVAQKRKLGVGDKMAGRHGNKGVVSRVLPVEDMPYLPNGRPLDIVLNPLGVPSRMNIGQVLETHLSLASKLLGIDIVTPTFEGADENDIQDTLIIANDYVNTEWSEFKEKYKDVLDKSIMDYLGKHLDHRDEWKGVHIGKDGKVLLRDGRTGEFFDSPTTIGFMHYLKLHHLVDDKIHARSIGPYSLVTQQPLGGKAQFGGQRFGEMEVWALEAYGAAYTLQEILTVKSDDMIGRLKVYEAIVKGKNLPKPTIPESFKVLLKELQALCLDVTVYDKSGRAIPMIENLYDTREDMRRFEREEYKADNARELLNQGFTEKEFRDDKLVNVDGGDIDEIDA